MPIFAKTGISFHLYSQVAMEIVATIIIRDGCDSLLGHGGWRVVARHCYTALRHAHKRTRRIVRRTSIPQPIHHTHSNTHLNTIYLWPVLNEGPRSIHRALSTSRSVGSASNFIGLFYLILSHRAVDTPPPVFYGCQ